MLGLDVFFGREKRRGSCRLKKGGDGDAANDVDGDV